jgi:hypothetical protein
LALTKDDKIYGNVSFATICEKIVTNSIETKNQIDILSNEVRALIKTPADAVAIIPVMRQYLDTGVRNDEQLVKLAAVLQRLISADGVDTKDSISSDSLGISEEEKQQLMEIANEMVEVNEELTPRNVQDLITKKKSQQS